MRFYLGLAAMDPSTSHGG